MSTTSESIVRDFGAFDTDGNGVIDLSELVNVIMKLDSKWSDEEIHRLFEAVDQDGNGNISYEEFVSYVFAEGSSNGQCPKGHTMCPLGVSRNNGWGCDGRHQPGGCKRNMTGFGQSDGIMRFRCKPCDYDLCDRCFLADAARVTCKKGHVLIPLGLSRNNSWGCDGRHEPGGCSGATRGHPRFRCQECDFDYCESCYNRKAATYHDVLQKSSGADANSVRRSTSPDISGLEHIAPIHWDLSLMESITSGKGLNTVGSPNLFAQIHLTDGELERIQELVDASFRKVYTRDRKGAAVPDGLQVEKGLRIQNAQNWSEFLQATQKIRQSLSELRVTGSSGFCPKGHILEPLGTSRDNGWGCDGRKDPGGCQSGLTGFRQTGGMNRFRCQRCDFDYCEKCYLARTGKKLCLNGHALVPLGLGRDNGWCCDGRKHPDGCLNGITNGQKSKGVNRYRCSACDWDLCDKCYRRHMGQVNSSVSDLKTGGILSEHQFQLDSEATCVWLFHGTSTEAADAITRGDFLIDKAGSNAGTLYGRGVYLAEACSKSDEYSTENADGLRCMLLCRCVLGNVLYNDDVSPNVDFLVHLCVNGPFDSVLGDREKARGTFREFIVYDDDQVYPEFVLWYRRVYNK